MKAESAAKWQLTESALDKLLAAFSDDREEAGEKYLQLGRNLVRYFEVRGIFNAEAAADEVFNRLARKLESGETFENINTYALGVARFLTLERRKSPEQKTSNELPEISYTPAVEPEEDRSRELVCLDRCLNRISAEKKEIIVGYYQGERREKIDNRRKIAEKLGIPPNALRNRAVRLRGKLESCIKKCVRDEK
jgi:RNA polymerase sigma factor (sigma-70 family)